MPAVSNVTAVRALWKREIVKFLRERSRVMGALAQPAGFWLLLGLGFHGTFAMPAGAAQNVDYLEYLFPGIIAMILLFTAIFSTITVVEERKSGFLQAALVAPVSRVALVFGNTLGGTTLAVAEAILFLVFVPFIGIAPNAAGLMVVLLVCVLTGLAFTALGFIIAWRMETTRGFHAVMNLFLLPLWFLSGAPFPVEGASAALRWIMFLNPVTYAVSAIRQALYWPAPAPVASAPPAVCVAVTVLFSAFLIAAAVLTVKKPLFKSV